MREDREDPSMPRSRVPRPWVAALAMLASVACVVASLRAPSVRAQLPSYMLHQYRVDVVGPTGAHEPVMVMYPRMPNRAPHPNGHRWPVVVALHGLGEAQRGVDRGAMGWSVDYALPRAYEAMLYGRLGSPEFGGFVRREHLARVNAWLRTRAFEGVAVVMPYTPAILQPDQAAERVRYSAWLAGPLLEQVRAAYPGFSRDKEGTGIDGISLGGRLSLEAGFRHPEAFGGVGGMQPAVRGDAEFLTGLVHRDAGQRIRLLSSDGDNFLVATRELATALRGRSIPHDLLVVPGPHDYPFNRGPASIELLRFAQMALHGEAVSDEAAATPTPAPTPP